MADKLEEESITLMSSQYSVDLEWISDCAICRDLWKCFTDTDPPPKFKLNPAEKSQSSKCTRHMCLVQSFQEYCRDTEDALPAYIKRNSSLDDMGIVMKRGSPLLFEFIHGLGRRWELSLLKNDSILNHPGIGRLLDFDWVDIDLVKKWKSQCLSLHGTKCENPLKIWPARPAWLVDIIDQCIVSGSSPGEYVALSYRCGTPFGFRADLNSISKLQERGALQSPEILNQLSPVVRHAMYLASAIGERYLWTDALCILHDDVTSKVKELNLMSVIYANATVTIIAADGDSQDGILGLRGVSSSRKLEHRVIPFGKEEIIVRDKSTYPYSLSKGIRGRGWTYQEYKVSKRKIMFLGKQVHWECECDQWHEELLTSEKVPTYIDDRFKLLVAGFPDTYYLSDIISGYNDRELSFDEDALPAISGLLAVASRTFISGFLFGLPEMLFERGLCWRPTWHHKDLRRRTASLGHGRVYLSTSDLPSWSWVGWQGLVSFSGEALRINDHRSRESEIIPIIDWYTSASPKGTPLRRIRSTWFENRHIAKDLNRALPAGWTRHDTSLEGSPEAGERLWPHGCGPHVFKHSAMPDVDWYYPFPVAQVDHSTPPFTPEQTPYLFCNTKRAHLLGRSIHLKDSIFKNKVTLFTQSKEAIGTLHLHNEAQLELFHSSENDDSIWKPVEVVAICRVREYSKTFDTERNKYGYPHIVTEFYNVLWIEWIDGVAYRLAIGSVEKKFWEELDLEDVSLVLG